MKYTSPLLKKFISINDTPENIAKNLILKTCEIEEISERKISDSIVIGYVTSCEQHPDADKLKVCMVDCGKKGSYQICCGGANVATGLYVPVALPGTVFEKAGMTIEPRKMRGIESNGMICSKEEIWIMEDMEKHSIWDLKEDLDDISDKDLGISLREKFPRLENRVMEVDSKSLTNRPDLTGHFGAAVELNAIYTIVESRKSKAEGQLISFNRIKEYFEQCTPKRIMQIIDNSIKPERLVKWESEALNAYLLLHLKNTKVQTSSFFTRLQMLDLGNNPISNRVDFSNLFMNISGQPVHFFDAEKVDGDIIVRNANDGEKFTDLFGTEHLLQSNDIVITDKKKILALAGVVWGLESWITENTKNILVEIANFDPVAVRKTGTRLSLRTDAELRFEKNINPRYTLFCLTLFLDELKYYKKDLGDFEIGGLSYYISPKLEAWSSKHIEVDTKVMEQFIFGQKVKWFDKKVEEILTGLWFTGKFSTQHLALNTPLWRGPDDLNIQEDIYEEVARIYGYDQIENLPLLSTVENIPYSDYVSVQRKIEDILVRNFACNQVETYPRVSEKILKDFGRKPEHCYLLQNPTHLESPYMRDSMIYNLLAHTAKNSKFFDTFKMFDIGKVWRQDSSSKREWSFASAFVHEKTELWILIYNKAVDQRDNDPILEAKHIAQKIVKELELWPITFEHIATPRFRLHPKKQALINIGDASIGFVWTLHPSILQTHKIGETSSVVYLSLDITALITHMQETKEHIYTFETLQDQIIWRDLCFVVDVNKNFDEVIEAVKKIPEVKEIKVFDVYAGKNLGEEKKSVSIKIKIMGNGDTTTEQINEILKKAIKAGENTGASLRA